MAELPELKLKRGQRKAVLTCTSKFLQRGHFEDPDTKTKTEVEMRLDILANTLNRFRKQDEIKLLNEYITQREEFETLNFGLCPQVSHSRTEFFCSLIRLCFPQEEIFCEGPSHVLPSWIEENPGFKEPKHVNAIQSPHGAIDEKGPGVKGWVVVLNEKKGHGIEIEIKNLSLNPDSEDFLMVAPWPLTTKFKQIKLFTGDFDRTLKLRIPNTKSFFILYNAFSSPALSKEMTLKYRRYGVSFETDHPSTESPVKKNTVFEIQLKGKPPKDYSDVRFSQNMKEALRAIARQYCLAHNIPFNVDIPTEKMVRIHRVSFCPFEWPERDICASLEHSIFVSGVILSDDQIIKDYELTAEHLRDMWRGESFPELEELGITVFVLPGTVSTFFWWLLITGLIIISSLVASFVFWKAEKHVERPGPRKKSTVFEEIKKKPKLKLGKLQRIPSFMYDSKKLKYPTKKPEESGLNGEVSSAPEFKTTHKLDSSSDLPIKNYYGSLLFASNAAFEEDEGNAVTES